MDILSQSSWNENLGSSLVSSSRRTGRKLSEIHEDFRGVLPVRYFVRSVDMSRILPQDNLIDVIVSDLDRSCDPKA